jgi:hypothetical protein
VLNLETSPYVAYGYTPLHVAYATNASGIAAAINGVRYANKTVPSTAICKSCRRVSETFDVAVTRAGIA